ncbi:MAG: sulfite exporter TauE/SafE family protein [Desulfovibrionaceae bacterium]|nr:sulfite exporter TauE/SafE family protein [Desulfovibrionaceae bacterium]
MEPLIAASVLATFLFAAFLKGTAGLGFATTCLGVMAAYLDLKTAIPLVIVPSLAANALVMFGAGGFVRVFRRFWPMFAAALPGLLLGLWILNGVHSDLPRAVLGASMVLYAAWGIWGGTFRLEHAPGPAVGVGLVTGLVNGLTGSQIMPVLPYLMSLPITKDELVQAINTSFSLSSLVMLAGMGKFGLLTRDVLLLSAVGIAPVGLGIWVGGKIRRRLPEAAFRKMVHVLVGALGLALIGRALA